MLTTSLTSTRSLRQLLALSALLCATSAHAACGEAGAPCGKGDPPANQPLNAAPPLGVGNPIHVASGNKYQQEVDLPALPGVLGLEIVRHYNSTLAGERALPGPLGRGWRLSYETELARVGNGIEITQADGSKLAFGRDLLDARVARHSDPGHGTITISTGARGEQYLWTWADGRKLSFDSRGRLEQIQAATGEIVTLQHDAQGLLTRVTDPQGRSLRLVWLDKDSARAGDRFRGVQHIETPVGRFTYGYGSALPKGASTDPRILLGNLVSVRYPEVGGSISGRRYAYEDGLHPTLLTGISNEGAAAGAKLVSVRYATYGYRADGKAILSTHAGNSNRVTLSYDAPGQTTVTNSLGQKTVYRFAGLGDEARLLEVRGPGCATCGETDMRYRYDKAGHLLESTKLDNDGVPVLGVRFDLDTAGRPVAVYNVPYAGGKAQPAQLDKRIAYGASDAPTAIVRPSVVPGKELRTEIAYNAAGQPVSVTDSGWAPGSGNAAPTPIARTTHYVYRTVNGRSVLEAIDGPLPNGKSGTPADSDITRMTWDESGSRIVAMTMPGDLRSTLSHDAAGRIAAVRDSAGQATGFSYSPRGLQQAVSTQGLASTTTYDAFEQAVETGVWQQGSYRALARFGFDAAGRQVWSASSLGILERQQFDTEDRLVATSRSSARMQQSRQYAYDARGRLAGATDINGIVRRILWNSQNLPEQTIDALGRSTRYRYDGAGHLVAVEADVPGEAAVKVDMTAQRGGSISAANGSTTTYVKDDFGRVLAVDSPDSGRSTRSYDAAGRIVASTDAKGNRASYEYDAAGRIVRQRVTENGATGAPLETRWTYAGKNLAAVSDPNQTEQYEYDSHNRMQTKTVTITLDDGTRARSVTRYDYDNLGQLSASTLPDGSRLLYRRNAQHQVVAVERSRVTTGWLAWLLPAQRLVSDIERDLAGLRHFVSGNGIVTDVQRSAQGNLARIVHARAPAAAALRTAAAAGEALMGVSPAKAATPVPAASGKGVGPGAFDLPTRPGALADQRYLWDAQGNLLIQQSIASQSSYAYDRHDRLIAGAEAGRDSGGAGSSFVRYAYDADGNRLLGQESKASQADLKTGTVAAAYAPGSNRWTGNPDGSDAVRYNAGGEPTSVGKRAFQWNALGKLTAVRNGEHLLASYRYNVRGERIAKAAGTQHRYYLYEDGLLAAELDERGLLVRQYVYLAGQPVLVIDQAPRALAVASDSVLGRIGADLAAIARHWFGTDPALTFLHNNHLGAPELATSADGAVVWHGNYAPFGQVTASGAFAHNLRLPGQYEDQETGLHYNHHRYYDPARGRYLSPDPLGLQAGANTYAYVSANPLKYVDPHGLILFAFDGTGNSENPPPEDTISNVLKLYRAYDQQKNGKAYYITGIGTTNADMTVKGNMLNGKGFDERLALGFKFLDDFIKTDTGTDPIDIDVVGFSRGATEARVWLNQLVAKLKDHKYTADGKTRCINLRFEGLWDTVPHLGLLNGDEKKYDFSIPADVKYAAHAVAMNEHRGGLTNFNIRSMWDAPGGTSSANRIEKGFIGSHADIGGAYGTGDLSDVALMWMIGQAQTQGLVFDANLLTREGWDTVTNPILHDKSSNGLQEGVLTSSRNVVYGNGAHPTQIDQRKVNFDGKTVAGTVDKVTYFSNPYPCISEFQVGVVNMAEYQKWLTEYGLTMKVGTLEATTCH